jgi:hypothetical protein
LIQIGHWIRTELPSLVARELQIESENLVKSLLRETNHSLSILDVMPIPEIVGRLFLQQESPRPVQSKKKNAQRANSAHLAAERLRNSSLGAQSDSCSILKQHPKHVKRVLEQLLRHQYAQYHLIPAAVSANDLIALSDPLEDLVARGCDLGLVALLSRVAAIPTTLVDHLCSGLTPEKFERWLERNPMWESAVSFHYSTMCCPIGLLRSPEIEFLVQRFAQQFVRVGVEDYPETLSEEIFGQIERAGEDPK